MNAVQRKRTRTVVTFTVLGGIAGFMIGLAVSQIDDAPWSRIGVRGLLIGIAIGAAIGVGEQWVVPALSRRVGFWALNASRFVLYGSFMLSALILINAAGTSIDDGIGFSEAIRTYVFTDTPGRDFALSLVAVLALTSLLELRTLHNRGEVWRLLSGRYRYPIEETRVFLFADLVGSTSLAERLGNLEYSSFLRECFRDTSEAVLAWRGEVYQFAGDGVIVTWRERRGFTDAACVRCYFEMMDALAGREAEYIRRYGVAARLRGAVHGGTVVTTWVGEAKRELAFHGDVLNAAARIESMTKEKGAECLVSAWVQERLAMPAFLESVDIGGVQLRGREEPVTLYAVRRAQTPT